MMSRRFDVAATSCFLLVAVACTAPKESSPANGARASGEEIEWRVPESAEDCAEGDIEACFSSAAGYRQDWRISDELAVRTLTSACGAYEQSCLRVASKLWELNALSQRRWALRQSCEAGIPEGCIKLVDAGQKTEGQDYGSEREQRELADALRRACRGGIEKACRELRSLGQRSKLVRRVDYFPQFDLSDVHGFVSLETGEVWASWEEGRFDVLQLNDEPTSTKIRVVPEFLEHDEFSVFADRGEPLVAVRLRNSRRKGILIWAPSSESPKQAMLSDARVRLCDAVAVDRLQNRVLVTQTKSTSSCREATTVGWWQLDSGERLANPTDMLQLPSAYAVDPEGDQVAVADMVSGAIEMRAIPKMSEQRTIRGKLKIIDEIEFGADGDRLAVTGRADASTHRRHLVLWDISGNSATPVTRWHGVGRHVDFSPDGDRLAFIRGGQVVFVDPMSGERLASPVQLTGDGDDYHPTFSQTSGSLVVLNGTLFRLGLGKGRDDKDEPGGEGTPEEMVQPIPNDYFLPHQDGVIQGRIDSRKNFVRGGEVRISPADEGEVSWETERVVEWDGRTFRVDSLYRGRWEIRLGNKGSPVNKFIDVGATPAELSFTESEYLRAYPSGGLSGGIIGKNGSPASDSVIWLSQYTLRDKSELKFDGGGPTDWDKKTVADDQGTYAFDNQQPGSGVLHVFHPTRGIARKKVAVKRPPERNVDVTLDGFPSDSVRFRVIGKSGESLNYREAAVDVSVDDEQTPVDRQREVVGSGADGSGPSVWGPGPNGWVYAEGLESGATYDIHVDYRGLDVYRRIQFSEARKLEAIEVPDAAIHLQHSTHRSSFGDRRSNISVNARCDDAEGAKEDRQPSVETNKSGTRIGPMRPRRCRVYAFDKKTGAAGMRAVEVTAGDQFNMEPPLEGPYRQVTGRLVSARSGRPIPGVALKITRVPGADVVYAETDAAGRFVFDRLVPGERTLRMAEFEERDSRSLPWDYRLDRGPFVRRPVEVTIPADNDGPVDIGRIALVSQ